MKFQITILVAIILAISGCANKKRPNNTQQSGQQVIVDPQNPNQTRKHPPKINPPSGTPKYPNSPTQTSNSSQQSRTDIYANFRQQCVNTINRYRATLNLPALKRWKNQESCADNEAKGDSAVGQAHANAGKCGEMAQNECPGWPSSQAVVTGCLKSMWDEGPGPANQEHGHYLYMSSKRHTKVACGFYQTPSGEIWAIQNFQ